MRQTLGDSRSQRTEQQALIEAFPKTLYQREPNPQAEQTSVLTRGQFSSCFNFQPSSCSASKTAAEQMLAPGAENLSLSPKLNAHPAHRQIAFQAIHALETLASIHESARGGNRKRHPVCLAKASHQT